MIFRKKKLQFYLEILTCDPLNYTMEYFKFITSIQKEEFISVFRVLLITIHIQWQNIDAQVYDVTPNLVLMSITELNYIK